MAQDEVQAGTYWSGLGKGLGLLSDFNVVWLKEGTEKLII